MSVRTGETSSKAISPAAPGLLNYCFAGVCCPAFHLFKEDSRPWPTKLVLKQVEEKKDALKQDHFITTTSNGMEWVGENRKSVIVTVSALLGLIILLVLVGVWINHRSNAAATAFGAAMQTYEAPLVTPGQPNDPGVKTYNSAADRAKGRQRAVSRGCRSVWDDQGRPQTPVILPG